MLMMLWYTIAWSSDKTEEMHGLFLTVQVASHEELEEQPDTFFHTIVVQKISATHWQKEGRNGAFFFITI